MHIDSLDVWGLCAPVFAFTALAIVLVCSKMYQALWKRRKGHSKRRFGLFLPTAALGCAFLPLAVMYRPSLALLAKAQIQQMEDVDEDDNGDPENPAKHLRRQLRRIRRGEPAERLTLQLE